MSRAFSIFVYAAATLGALHALNLVFRLTCVLLVAFREGLSELFHNGEKALVEAHEIVRLGRSAMRRVAVVQTHRYKSTQEAQASSSDSQIATKNDDGY